MAYLLDTNVMWRRFHQRDPNHESVKKAADALLDTGDLVCITAQNLIEFQSIATRPLEANGLGYSPLYASRQAEEIKSSFSFLPDIPEIYHHWRHLVDRYNVVGRQVHDARLVAVMLTFGVTHLLTLNPAHFRRFSEITVIEP